MSHLDARASAWLEAQGVAPMAMYQWPGPLGVARIVPSGRWYEPAEGDGVRAFLQPVFSAGPYSDVIDIAAWMPADPARCWLRLGEAWALGMEQIDRAEIYGTPLRLHRTPSEWLAAGGMGAAVLDWTGAIPHLRMVPVLHIDNLKFAGDVKRRLAMARPRVPDILVRQEARAAA